MSKNHHALHVNTVATAAALTPKEQKIGKGAERTKLLSASQLLEKQGLVVATHSGTKGEEQRQARLERTRLEDAARNSAGRISQIVEPSFWKERNKKRCR